MIAAVPKFALYLGILLLSSTVQAADTAQDLKTLHSVQQTWMTAYNAGDAETIIGLYDDDALLMPPNQPAVSGKAAIRSHFLKDVPGARKSGIVVSSGAHPDGASNGDMGWESGTYTVKDKAGRAVEAGKYLLVFKKKAGKWLLARDIWNADSAPAPAAK